MTLAARGLCALAAAVAALPVASPLAIERGSLPRMQETPWAPRGVSLAFRKEPEDEPDSAPEAPLPTLGTLSNLHTGDLLPLSDLEPTGDGFSTFAEDRGLNRHIAMAPELVELFRRLAHAHPGVRINLVSGYRSEKRNEMMRKKGRHVASHSQHTLGHAVDFRVEGLGVGEMVRALERLGWGGGVGRYDGRGDLFVHADVGPKRHWRGD